MSIPYSGLSVIYIKVYDIKVYNVPDNSDLRAIL